MRLFLSTLLTALIVPLAAHAQAPKKVEVINDPLAVEVVNPVYPRPPVRWQLVGFTSATYTGDMGGHFGVMQKCELEFPNSRMCTTLEAQQTTTIPAGLTGEAWVNPGIADFSGLVNRNCSYWTHIGGGTGRTISATGGVGSDDCLIAHEQSIACCALVP